MEETYILQPLLPFPGIWFPVRLDWSATYKHKQERKHNTTDIQRLGNIAGMLDKLRSKGHLLADCVCFASRIAPEVFVGQGSFIFLDDGIVDS